MPEAQRPLTMRARLRLLLAGVLLPLGIVFGLYRAVVEIYRMPLQGQAGVRTRYLREVVETAPAADEPAVDLLVLGDSTARSGIDPTAFRRLVVLNLGVNAGTALTSYHMLAAYLDKHPPPNCVLYLSQMNWKKNYEVFFARIVRPGMFSWQQLRRVWSIGAERHIFPATTHSALGFFIKAWRASWWLDELPVADLQSALRSGPRNEMQERAVHRLNRRRGFQVTPVKNILPEDRFFTGMHHAYLDPFVPSPTEDHYVKALAQLAQANGFHLLYGTTPVADSEQFAASGAFRTERDQHVRRLVDGLPGIEILSLTPAYSRDFFIDFSHLSARGGRRLTHELQPALSRCFRSMSHESGQPP